MFSETGFDNSFSEFRQIREMRFGTIVCEIFSIKTRLIEMRMNRTIFELIYVEPFLINQYPFKEEACRPVHNSLNVV